MKKITPHPLHILIIEDHLGDFILIEEYLSGEHEQIQLSRATTFGEARELLQENKYHAVLLDLSLPDSTDSELLVKECVTLCDKSPVIVLTGFSNKSFGVKTLSLGISDYLLKDDLDAVQLSKSIYYSIERKKIERDLSESEKKYKSLFDLSPQPMWVLDREHYRFLSVNDAAVKTYGYTKEEFLHMQIRDLWSNSSEPKIEEMLTTKKDDFFEIRVTHKTKGGELLILEVQSSPIIFDGIPARLSHVNDVTARVQAEQDLIHSEQRFRALVQDGSDLLMVLDFEGKFSYVSPSARAVTGFEAGELEKNNFFYIIHEEDVTMVKQNLQLLKYQKRIQLPSYRVKAANEQWRWIETILTNLTADPAVKGIVANSRDITDFVLQERKLRESLQRYDIVAKATSDTITDYDVQNDFMQYNEGIQNMFGYCTEYIKSEGSWWSDKIHPEDKERVRARTREAYSKGENQLQINYRFRCADGSYKYIFDRSYIIWDASGKPVRVISSMQDITEVNNYIKTIENHNAKLKEIAWTQSHVVRAPLARIMGLIDLLQNHNDMEDQNIILENIISSARELDTVIRKINSKTEGTGLKFIKC